MRKTLLIALTMCLVLAACGGGQPQSETGTPKATPTEDPNIISPPVALPGKVTNQGTDDRSFQGANVSLDMDVQNFFFDPTFIRTVPGATVTLRLTNRGNTQHTFNTDAPAIEQVLMPGDRKTIEIKLPESGVVNFYCKLHRTEGEQGALYFKVEGAPEFRIPGAGESTVRPEQQGATPGGATPETGM